MQAAIHGGNDRRRSRFCIHLSLGFAWLALAGCSSPDTEETTAVPEASSYKPDLADITYDRILKQHGKEVDPSKLPPAQQTVLLVYHASGILDNGGFQYLFEGNFPGDPGYRLTREAFKTIGATEITTAFDKAFAVFPNSEPPADVEKRIEMWQAKYKLIDAMNDKNSPDGIYFSVCNGTMEKLIAYIKANEAEFASLPQAPND